MQKDGAQVKTKDPLYQVQAILSRRDHSEHEVRTKLARKKFTQQQIRDAIAWLKENNLLDDRRFAFTFVENTLRFKAVGPRWLRAKLHGKGVASDVIDEVLGETFPEGREEELVREATRQWKRQHKAHGEDSQRLTRFLLSRGFSAEVVRELIAKQ